jgi:hypothetical protein
MTSANGTTRKCPAWKPRTKTVRARDGPQYKELGDNDFFER